VFDVRPKSIVVKISIVNNFLIKCANEKSICLEMQTKIYELRIFQSNLLIGAGKLM